MGMQGAVAPQLDYGDVDQELVSLRTELILVKESRETVTDELKGAKELLAEKDAEISDLEQQVSARDDELDELRSQRLREDEISDLAKVRTLLKSGKCDEGREALERVLDQADNCWRLSS